MLKLRPRIVLSSCVSILFASLYIIGLRGIIQLVFSSHLPFLFTPDPILPTNSRVVCTQREKINFYSKKDLDKACDLRKLSQDRIKFGLSKLRFLPQLEEAMTEISEDGTVGQYACVDFDLTGLRNDSLAYFGFGDFLGSRKASSANFDTGDLSETKTEVLANIGLDNKRIFQLPIYERFPKEIIDYQKHMSLLPFNERPVYISFLGAITKDRPGRIDMMDHALGYCWKRWKKCTVSMDLNFVLENSKTKEKAVFSYFDSLSQAAFVLCPGGHNPDTHRIYEAMRLGAIPIIHDTVLGRDDEGVLHADCLQAFQFLKDMSAPVIFIDDWKNLEFILESYSEKDFLEMQKRLLPWVHSVGEFILSTIAIDLIERFE
eukprot:Awhi_evm1s10126